MNRDLCWLLSTYLAPTTFKLHSCTNKLIQCILFNDTDINSIKKTLRNECNNNYLSKNPLAVAMILIDIRKGGKNTYYTWLIQNPDIFTISEKYKKDLDLRIKLIY